MGTMRKPSRTATTADSGGFSVRGHRARRGDRSGSDLGSVLRRGAFPARRPPVVIGRLRTRLAAWFGRRPDRAGSSAPGATDGRAVWAESPPDRLIVGLGNPGPEYAVHRHNIGFRVVERLAERAGAEWFDDRGLEARLARVEIGGLGVCLMEPQTFMNRSGQSVERACARWQGLAPAEHVCVVYDDLDLPTGRLRVRRGGGAGGHRGMASVLDELGTRAIPRLRFGVGHPGQSQAVIDWVLGPFAPQEEARLDEAIDRAADALECAVREGIEPAMGRFNQEA